MKLEKAIEIKENYLKIHSSELYEELLDADRMSIEALKFFKLSRELWGDCEAFQLPGETKD